MCLRYRFARSRPKRSVYGATPASIRQIFRHYRPTTMSLQVKSRTQDFKLITSHEVHKFTLPASRRVLKTETAARSDLVVACHR